MSDHRSALVWTLQSGAEISIPYKDIRDSLTKLKCTNLRGMVKALRIPGYGRMRKADMVSVIIKKLRTKSQKFRRADISTPDNVQRTCAEVKQSVGGWFTGAANTPLQGLLCSLASTQASNEKKQRENYSRLRDNKACEKPNHDYPAWNMQVGSDCAAGYVHDRSNKKNPFDGCCIKADQYIAMWDPVKMKDACDGCEDTLNKDQKQVIYDEIDAAKAGQSGLASELASFSSPKEAKFVLNMIQKTQMQMVTLLGGQLDELIGLHKVDSSECSEDGKVGTSAPTGWLASAIKSSALGVGMALSLLYHIVSTVVGWAWGVVKVAAGGVVYFLKSMGEKLAFMIVSNPRSAKIMLASAKLMRSKMCRFVGEKLMDSSYMDSIETYMADNYGSGAAPLALPSPAEIISYDGTQAEYEKENGLNLLTVAKKANSGGDDDADGSMLSNLFGRVKSTAADTAQFVSDIDVTTEALHGITESIDFSAMGSKYGGYMGRILGGMAKGVPFVGGAIGETIEIVGELTGGVMANATKAGLETTLYQTDVFSSLDLLLDILDPGQCMAEMPRLRYKYPATFRKLRQVKQVASAFAVRTFQGQSNTSSEDVGEVMQIETASQAEADKVLNK